MLSQDAIEVRLYQPESDRAFIYSTWLRNYKHSSYFAKRIKHAIFFSGHHKIIDHLLSKPETKTFIACPKNDPDTMLGYLVCEQGEKPVVHFTFVKEAFRRMGVARTLFVTAGVHPNSATFTHWTMPVDELIKKFTEMTYDPYRL